mmetsp:Transcript_10121/g.20073  ORF Transcript_10121/g.20073 Transcript_10121/m.20073 type:complete len:381 (-) Transcript_10121:63-1205(-)
MGRNNTRQPGSGRRSAVLSRAGDLAVQRPSSSQFKTDIIAPSLATQQRHSARPKMEQKAMKGGVKMELEHAIGYDGHICSGLHYHKGVNILAAGGNVNISDPLDPHKQKFLRGGHENSITVLALSRPGDMIASGGEGRTPDVIVWDFSKGNILYRLQEHEHGISALGFSDDGRFLGTCGNGLDKKLFIWDMKTGMIVASTVFDEILMLVWGGRVRDKKRRPTSKFLFGTVSRGGKQQKVTLWALDPKTGKLESMTCTCGSHVRKFTCIDFSNDGEWLYAGTTSGDVAVFQVKRAVLYTFIGLHTLTGGVTAIAVPPPPACSSSSRGDDGEFQEVCVGGATGILAHLSYDGKSYKADKRARLDGAVKTEWHHRLHTACIDR